MTWRNDERFGTDYEATDEQRMFSWMLVNHKSFANRGELDGSVERQYVGILGQTIVSDLLEVPRPEAGVGPDGGVDFMVCGKAIDLKTTARNKRFLPHWTIPLKVSQVENGITSVYLFASLDKTSNVLTILGWLKKIDLRREWYRAAGTTTGRDDRSTMTYGTDTYAIPARDLRPWDSISRFVTDMTMFG